MNFGVFFDKQLPLVLPCCLRIELESKLAVFGGNCECLLELRSLNAK